MGHRASLDGCGEEDVLPVPGFEARTIQHVANVTMNIPSPSFLQNYHI